MNNFKYVTSLGYTIDLDTLKYTLQLHGETLASVVDSLVISEFNITALPSNPAMGYTALFSSANVVAPFTAYANYIVIYIEENWLLINPNEFGKLSNGIDPITYTFDGIEWTETGSAGAGSPGPQGPRGIQGDMGIRGLQGPQGIQGTTGVTGPIGPRGPRGFTGEQGIAGPIGAEGPTGAQGDMGDRGTTGDRGETGAQGETGLEGAEGTQGEQGIQGSTGPTGPTGPTGAQGDPAAPPIQLLRVAATTTVPVDRIKVVRVKLTTLSTSLNLTIKPYRPICSNPIIGRAVYCAAYRPPVSGEPNSFDYSTLPANVASYPVGDSLVGGAVYRMYGITTSSTEMLAYGEIELPSYLIEETGTYALGNRMFATFIRQTTNHPYTFFEYTNVQATNAKTVTFGSGTLAYSTIKVWIGDLVYFFGTSKYVIGIRDQRITAV